MNSRRSIFTIATGRRSKWVVFLIWVVGIFIAAGPAQLPTKFADAENNESTSFLPGDAESTHALTATEDLQGGELAPAVIVYERKTGLTPADFAKIREDVAKMTTKRFPGVIRDGATAAAGGKAGGASEGPAPEGGQAPTEARARAACPRAAAARRRRSPASLPTTRPSSARSARRTARPRSSRPT